MNWKVQFNAGQEDQWNDLGFLRWSDPNEAEAFIKSVSVDWQSEPGEILIMRVVQVDED